MPQRKITALEPYVLSLLRIIAGFTFSLHGVQKILGLLGGLGGTSATAKFFSLIWIAGFLELVGGLLLVLGLFTVPTAFLLSGEMAMAYFVVHLRRGFWPILNGGELAALYSLVFLYLFTAGPGPWSLDRLLRKKAP